MRSLRVLVTSLLTGCAVLAGVLVIPASAAAATPKCSIVSQPVSVIPLLPMTAKGQLCVPDTGTPKTMQLLLHGATYNRVYWDLPYQPARYSYQRDMATRGLATFAVDELGVGGSSRPLSTLLTGAAQASAVHQLVGDLRAGRVDGVRYDKVVLVGHSAGSAISVIEAATYRDVDGVILTGVTHLPNVPVVVGDVVFGLYPVTLDPQLGPRGDDPGYLTTKPGTRGPMYFGPAQTDPLAVAADEAYAKDTVSATSLLDIIGLGLVSPLSRGIDVPVLLVNGTDDTGFCGLIRDCSTAEALRAQEAPYFSAAAQLSVYVLSGAGHSVALATNSPDYRNVTRDWLSQYVG
ncbi:pimeloyl-ACP methyl ester carboxylesterase [Kibdelosporangium banguiense]|uniref:Pimeloyl-ACP methyl ester carboxylesterase n=1 Tax=Kibdelosporangium banguiense TaxID=1365924 RepID=A0ABS4U1B7_9PSEU|nr:alpha/beta hydrolase [Kibdelosporangium banguiense]MBP2330450.1 pimeloyl-ACP methyl ester carboxylesterase [Kibdelosporangium banguiense]